VSLPLAGRRELVTGAGSGIGRACALLLARHGAAVALLDVREDALAEAAVELDERGGRAIALPCDVGEEASVRAAVTSAVAQLGGLDTVVAARASCAPGARRSCRWRSGSGSCASTSPGRS
jgi:NAD(P)-dependent dehydrogenase (short-subunit alcohol dehydrogenase family)